MRKILYTTPIITSDPVSGIHGRIPAICVSTCGTLLLAYERRTGRGDWSRQQLILHRSTDQGRTFEAEQILAEDEASTFHNPTFIVDGPRVHLFYGSDYERAYHRISTDEGKTFSAPREITSVFEPLAEAFPYNVIAIGPGHGIRLEHGPHPGRLITPVWIAKGEVRGRIREHRPSIVAALYSDDQGTTWKISEPVPQREDFRNPSETGVLERSDGTVMLNLRNESAMLRRGLAFSADGGTTFTDPEYCEDLIDPICFGSSVKAPDGSFYYVGCRDEHKRIHLTLMAGSSDGRSWTPSQELVPFSGYADLAADGDTLYVFYEESNEKGAITSLQVMALR